LKTFGQVGGTKGQQRNLNPAKKALDFGKISWGLIGKIQGQHQSKPPKRGVRDEQIELEGSFPI